jgi:outer membrane protein OmpA-like peptidoglycan-associated protein
MGGMDIYACVRNADDSWGKPTNLGSKINTSGNEVFPTVHNNMLYFSSDYHPGFGGLDVFYIPLDGSAMAENAGLPMNSPKDDFGLCFEPDGKTGYFTSNRNSANKDDIYFFTMETGYHIHGTLLDCLTHAPVPQARIDLLGADGSMVTTFTDSLGEYSYTVYNRSEFELMARHEMYTSTDGCSGKYALTTEGMFDGQVLETVLALDPMEAANLQQAFLCGRVMHSIYGNPLAEVQVCVQHGQDEFEVTTTASGAFFVPVSNGAEVQIDVTRTAFEELTTSLTVVKSQDQCHAVDIAMVPNRLAEPPLLTPEIIVQPGMVIELYHVYFDRDQHELREDAMPDLRTFLQILRDNPGVSGVLSAHTDSRASDKYNYDLSVRRAKAVYDYLVANGISADRLTARGFGESQPINHCIDGVNCSEQEHQRNRRVEFEVVDVNKKLNSKSEEPAVFTDSVD